MNGEVVYDEQGKRMKIYQDIFNCPAHMALREFVMNAIEAAVECKPVPGDIEFFIETVQGIPKLVLYNEGPGMGLDQLFKYMNMAASSKTMGTSKNFGQGAKVAGLKSNPYGVVYRSCHAGQVHETTLAWQKTDDCDFPIAKRLERRFVIDGVLYTHHVEPVTGRYRNSRDRHTLKKDWTEVVFLGTGAEHNTVDGFVRGDKGRWQMKTIQQRFYSFPTGVQIKHPNVKEKTSCIARGLLEVVDRFTDKSWNKETEHPFYGRITVRYTLLRRDRNSSKQVSSDNNMDAYGMSSKGHICLVWQGAYLCPEIYEIITPWTTQAHTYGILHGAEHVCVHVLLRDKTTVHPSQYRDYLLRTHYGYPDDTQQVNLKEFASLITDNIPKELKDWMATQEQSSDNDKDVHQRLCRFAEKWQARWDELQIETGRGKGSASNYVHLNKKDGEITPDTKPRPYRSFPLKADPNKPGSKATARKSGLASPYVKFADEQQYRDTVGDHAATWVKEAETVFLSRDWWFYRLELQRLLTHFAPRITTEDHRTLAIKTFDECYKYSCGTWVVKYSVEHGHHSGWDDTEVNAVLTNACFSVYMALDEAAYDEAKTQLRELLPTVPK